MTHWKDGDLPCPVTEEMKKTRTRAEEIVNNSPGNEICEHCGGYGKLCERTESGDFILVTCPICEGTGYLPRLMFEDDEDGLAPA